MNEVKTYAVNCNDAWLNTKGDDISGSYVKYADYLELAAQLANAESKCRELAAENTELKSDRDTLARYWIEGGGDEECANSYCEQTPATDAFLAEMRAQGVDQFKEYMRTTGYPWEGDWHGIGRMTDKFAAQLRQGGAA